MGNTNTYHRITEMEKTKKKKAERPRIYYYAAYESLADGKPTTEEEYFDSSESKSGDRVEIWELVEVKKVVKTLVEED